LASIPGLHKGLKMVEYAIKMIGSETDVCLPYRLLCYRFKIKNIAEAKFLNGLMAEKSITGIIE
jgi:hypothetical protein